MFKSILNIFRGDFKRLKNTLFCAFFALQIFVALPKQNYAQSLPKITSKNNHSIFVKINSQDNINKYFALYDEYLYKFKRNKSLFNQKTYIELEKHFQNHVVYLSKNNIYSLDISANNYSYNTIKFTTTPIVHNAELHFNSNYSFVEAKSISESFIATVDRNQFYNSYSLNTNNIQTTEFSVLSFQSEVSSQYLSGTKFWGGIGFAMFGTLMLLPRSVTKWEEGYIEDATSNFSRAFSEPPVMDEDHWEINYIGHPYAGSLYYNTIRSQGGSVFQSFMFSAFVSTGWEYLYEGAAEQPSIQDLIVTPVLGSILGEAIHQTTLSMKSNGYSIWEAIFVTIFNPMDVIQNGYK